MSRRVLSLHVMSPFKTCLDSYSVIKRPLAVRVVQRGARALNALRHG